MFDSSKIKRQIQLKTFYFIPRFTPITTNLLGKPLKIADSASFMFMYSEIFEKEIYKFSSTLKSPNIIDCGANIRLSVIYFKNIFPKAKITCFEPDKEIFSILAHNVKSFNLSKVMLINKALWDKETELSFAPDKADGGRICKGQNKSIYKVETERLSRYLTKPVDFLKIDIEGAEVPVLEESKKYLKNVKRMFVEYHSFQGEEQKLNSLLQIISANGFRYYIEHIGVASSHPFCTVRTTMGIDNQLNIYCYR
jgi:FkbM family methyltransferase